LPFAVVNGVNLYYEVRGSGPPLLIIPGVPAVVSDCQPLVDGLDDAFTVVVFDNRGSGQSDKPDERYSTRQMAADAVALLDHLGIDRAHILGFSLGGMIGQYIALDFPDHVERLVLACTHGGFSQSVPPTPETSKAFQLETGDWGERIKALAGFAFTPGFVEQEAGKYEAFVSKKSADVQPAYAFRRQVAAATHHDAFDRLAAISCPTLVISGSEDSVVPAENSRMLAERIPGARLEILPDTGHLFFIEQPEESLSLIRAFLPDNY
jgi:3-oxoadipate enol-lactonase